MKNISLTGLIISMIQMADCQVANDYLNNTYLHFSNYLLSENDVRSYQILLLEYAQDSIELMHKSVSYLDSAGYVTGRLLYYEGSDSNIFDSASVDVDSQQHWDLNCVEPDMIDTLMNGGFILTRLDGYQFDSKAEYERYWEFDSDKILRREVVIIRPCFPSISSFKYFYNNGLLDQIIVRSSRNTNIPNIDSTKVTKTIDFKYSEQSQLTNVIISQSRYPPTVILEYVYLPNGLLDKIEIPALNSRIQISYTM